MENWAALLEHWRQVEPQLMALGKLKVDPAFQPRNPSIVPFADRARMDAAAERHVAKMADDLSDGELEPMLVADIAGRLVVVDGHHRRRAHRRAGRGIANVRVMPMTADTAHLLSKLVNCDGAKLPMHAEQSRECAWQALAAITKQGKCLVPDGTSMRRLGRTFGTSRETIGAMLRRLPEVKPADYSGDACDPGSGWPQWKWVKGNATRDRFADVPEDLQERHKDERRAAKLAAIIDKDGIDAFLRSIELVTSEAVGDAAARLAEVMQDNSGSY